MQIIKITKIPIGEAPLEVREQWVGLELPFLFVCPESENCIEVDTGNPRPLVWVVPPRPALEILASKSQKAAQWFYKRGSPHKGEIFTFGIDEAVVVENHPFSMN